MSFITLVVVSLLTPEERQSQSRNRNEKAGCARWDIQPSSGCNLSDGTITILVNFHCHSIFSDGDQTPEALAANLAAAGVRYAALTDHDTLEGLPRFQDALKKRGMACLPGVELTTQFNGRKRTCWLTVSIPTSRTGRHPAFPAPGTRSGSAQHRRVTAQNWRQPPERTQDDPPVSAAPDGSLETGDAIALIHRAGGRAFWAHPLVFEPDLERLEACVGELKSKGLDGLEAIYASFSAASKPSLCALAQKHDLLVCAGTDFHHSNGVAAMPMASRCPAQTGSVSAQPSFSSPTFAARRLHRETDCYPWRPAARLTGGKPHHFRRRSFVLRIFLPTLIAIGLFLAAIWGIILPSFEQTLLDRKREMIRELTNSAWSILASYERDEQNGLLTREQAQALAITRIEALRYGPEGKDYFWIQDMQPRMIMHPYRTDLNGQELLSFTDPRGVRIFVEFADLVRREGEGYIDYVWQWKDDPQRLEPKESYVKGFAPWGWIIGTGIYTDDVHA